MEIRAPLSGVVVPLDGVPDEVFAQRLVGDGLAIDPTSSELLAPVGGRVTQLHAAKHAVAVTSDEGVEVLMHVGLDTVSLKGRGFEAHVKVGDRVDAGQVLLSFDADLVGRSARSLVTVVLVTNLGSGRTVVPTRASHVVAGKQVLFTVKGEAAAQATEVVVGQVERSAPIRLPNPAGLHARPSAVLAQEAKRFTSTVSLVKGHASANAKSVIAIMGLATRQDDEIVVEAVGPDAAAAVKALSKKLRDGSGEVAAAKAPVSTSVAPVRHAKPGVIGGIAAAPGLALGRVVQLRTRVPTVPEKGGNADFERQNLDAALREADAMLAGAQSGVEAPERVGILGVQRELLTDPELSSRAREGVERGQGAAFAWQRAYRAQAEALEALDNPLLRERASDVRDVGLRVLRLLAGDAATAEALPPNAVVIAEEITPTQLASFDPAHLVGLVTTTGSATSHVAILARGMGVPVLCGADASALSLAEGLEVVLDGTQGTLEKAPPVSDLAARAKLDEAIARARAQREAERLAARSQAQTRDGFRVAVVANVRNLDETREAMEGGAEGVGLLRSEFSFFDRDAPPTEDEQAEIYQAIARLVGKGRPLVIRTLDVGGDKPLPYLPLPKEGNPFLGIRGVRVSLERPDLFRTQLRAIVRAAQLTDLHVMFPMISGLEELRAARQLLDEETPAGTRLQVGIMIEVPSAVMMADQLAREVDFFSIGTNDLTQYALAMDRGHPQLAKRADALHPAVLKLIAATADAARKHGRPLHVCGGIASDPLAAPLLVGLGVTELSVSVPAVGAVKAALARWTKAECEALAEEVLALGTTAEVRALLKGSQPGARRIRVLATVGG
jgi:phosphocarrier protein FPr/phosphocarrier protein